MEIQPTAPAEYLSALADYFVQDSDEKRCAKCKEWKPREQFCLDRHNKDGLHGHCRSCRAAHRAANPGKNRAYRAANRERYRVHSHKQRARVQGVEGTFTPAEWEAKLRLYRGRCHWCRKKIQGPLQIDHVLPLSKGGTNRLENVVPCCARCNLSKGSKLPHDFAGRLF
jgi:5-methylcytosine-specific restriction endonuclease McrA